MGKECMKEVQCKGRHEKDKECKKKDMACHAAERMQKLKEVSKSQSISAFSASVA